MALTKKTIVKALEGLIVNKNGDFVIKADDVDEAIERISGSFVGVYASVESEGKLGQRLAIGNAQGRVSKPLVIVYIREKL